MRFRLSVWMGLAALSIVLFTSCYHTKELAYVSDAERDSAQVILNNYTATIHPGDQLYIYVSSQTPESVIPFNEETNKSVSALAGSGNAAAQTANLTLQAKSTGYNVSDDGYIIFPVLGKILAAGLTRDTLAHVIEHRLLSEGQVTDPVVEVKMMNFRVAVIGEVKYPKELHLTSERITIFEALAMCGDITMDGKRTNVGVLRETDGIVILGEIDLTSKELFNSPYYYLQQNDIVYVEPTKKKKRLATRNPKIPIYISFGTSMTRFALMIYNRYILDRYK